LKKGLTIGIALITTLSLAACGNSQAKSDKAKKDSSSLVAKKKAHAKKESMKKAKAASESKAKAESESKASSIAASSSSAASVATSQSRAAQSSSTTRAQQTASSSSQAATNSTQSTGAITNSAQAVAAAEAKYGNNGGDWKWGCLSGDPQSGFFVKAISQSQLDGGSMTGTAQSVMVYGDGTIVSN
jgi:membrane protein involved in colicin uptake